MPTNRTRIARPPRHPKFTDEALTLFVELERLSQDSAEFKAGSKRLAFLLGLSEEFFLSGVTVNDASKEPPWPPGHIAHEDWVRCHERRELLLQVLKERPPLRLTDAELNDVLNAVTPVAVERRDDFLRF